MSDTCLTGVRTSVLTGVPTSVKQVSDGVGRRGRADGKQTAGDYSSPAVVDTGKDKRYDQAQ